MLKAFGEAERVRVRRSEDGYRVVTGRMGEIYEHGPGRLAVMLLNLTPRKWNRRRAAMEAAGFTVEQDGDSEGACSFDPTNKQQAELAISVARVRRRRILTDEQKAELTIRLESFRAAQENRSEP